MTIMDVSRLAKYSSKNPPQRILMMAIASALGIQFNSPEAEGQKPLTAEEFERLCQVTGGRIPGVGQFGVG